MRSCGSDKHKDAASPEADVQPPHVLPVDDNAINLDSGGLQGQFGHDI